MKFKKIILALSLIIALNATSVVFAKSGPMDPPANIIHLDKTGPMDPPA